jgi:hypothetical protein
MALKDAEQFPETVRELQLIMLLVWQGIINLSKTLW